MKSNGILIRKFLKEMRCRRRSSSALGRTERTEELMSGWRRAGSVLGAISESPRGRRRGDPGALDLDAELSSSRNGSPDGMRNPDSMQQKPKMASYREQLDKSQEALKSVLERAVTKMLTEVIEPNTAAGDEERNLAASVMNGGVVGVFDWVQLQANQVLADLSDTNQETCRQSLTELKVNCAYIVDSIKDSVALIPLTSFCVSPPSPCFSRSPSFARGVQFSYETKLSHSRTASELKLQNQAVEMESTFNRKLEDKMTEITNGSGDQLREANQRVEELQQELNTIKLKLKGVEEVRDGLWARFSVRNKRVRLCVRPGCAHATCSPAIRLQYRQSRSDHLSCPSPESHPSSPCFALLFRRKR